MLPEGGIGVGVGVGEAVVLVESGQPGIVDSNCTYTQACDHCPERTYDTNASAPRRRRGVTPHGCGKGCRKGGGSLGL